MLPVLLFDLDGTLVDSAPDLAFALNDTLVAAGRRALPLETIRTMIGEGAASLARHAFNATGGLPDNLDEEVVKFRALYNKNAAVKTTAFPGVYDALNQLQAAGYRMGLCTNKPEDSTEVVLSGLKLSHYFEAVAGGDTFAVRKPDPGHITGLLGMMNAKSDRAIMIGDSPHDAGAAKAAGVPFIAVTYGYRTGTLDDLNADCLVDHFSDIPAAIDTLL